MTEVSTPAAAPAAAPAVETPAAPAAGEHLTPRERAVQRAAAGVVKAESAKAEAAKPRNERGEYVGKDGGQEAAPAAKAAAEQAAAPKPPAEGQGVSSQPPAGEPAAGFERIRYPEGHPLRANLPPGVDYEDVPVGPWVTRIRALLAGTYTRRQEVEAAQRQAEEARAVLARREAEERFKAENGSALWTEADERFYQDAKKVYGPEMAETYKNAKMAEGNAAIAEAGETAEVTALAGRVSSEGVAFREDAITKLPEMFEGLTSAEAAHAVRMYAIELDDVQARFVGTHVQRGMSEVQATKLFLQRFGGYNERDFFAVARSYLETRPGVLAAKGQREAKAELERNRIKAEVEAETRNGLRAAAVRHSQNPNRNLGGAAAAVPGAAVIEGGEPDYRGKSASAQAKERKATFLERWRGRLPRD